MLFALCPFPPRLSYTRATHHGARCAGTSPDPPAFANTFAALAGTVSPPLRRRRPSSGSKRGHTEFDHSDGDLASGASSADEESHRSAWHRLEKQGHQLSAGTRGARAEKKSVQRVAPKNDSAFQTSEGDISIVVGSRRFVCDGKIFAKHPNTMLVSNAKASRLIMLPALLLLLLLLLPPPPPP